MKVRFSGFDWDSGNAEKCLHHGVLQSDIEDFFCGETFFVGPDKKHSHEEDRFFAIGKIPKTQRHVFVVFTLRHTRQETLIRPISARFMHKKEIHRYEQAFAETKD